MDQAVLTGDFVRSRAAGADVLDRGFAVLDRACEVLADWHGAPLRPTRFRGDGWQALLAHPPLAFRSALYVQASLRAADIGLQLRLAMAQGAVTRTGGADLSDADGPAFHDAGSTLDAMGRGRRLAAHPGSQPLLPSLVTLSDAILQRWTVAQAEALVCALPPEQPTQSEIAERLGIRQQSLSERLDGAGFWALSDALETVETAMG